MMDATADAIDYLGRRQPRGQQVIGGLPTSESAFGGESLAPVTPALGGGGAGGAVSGGGVAPLAAIAKSPTLTPESQSALALAARTLGAGQQGWGWLRSFFGDSGPDTGAAGDIAGGVGAAAFGADIAPSWAALGSALGAAGPIWAGLTSAVDLLGEGKLPFQGLIESLFGLGGPSKAWMNFGGGVRNTLQSEELANEQLGGALLDANTPESQQAALGAWRQAIGAVLPGWGKGAGAWDIPDIAGGTGQKHEWKTEFDFAPEILGLRSELDAARRGLPADQRKSAFLEAARTWQGEQDAKAAERQRQQDEWQRMYDLNVPGSA